jgi:hypothetical protein
MKKKPAPLIGKKLTIGQPPSTQTTSKPVKTPKPQPIAPVSLVAAVKGVQKKFEELKQVRAQLTSVRNLYRRHDELVKELLPLFIEGGAKEFTIKREIQIGSETYRFTPNFWDSKKSEIMARDWRSCAFPTGVIE